MESGKANAVEAPSKELIGVALQETNVKATARRFVAVLVGLLPIIFGIPRSLSQAANHY